MLITDVHPLWIPLPSAKMSSGGLGAQLVLTRIRGVSIAGSLHYPVLDHLLKDWSDLSNRLTGGDCYLVSVEALSPPLS
jgi:hypothetical protein